MEIFELAKKLGETLKEDSRLVALEEAKKAYESNAKLQKELLEYEVQQKALQNEMVKEEKDTHFIEIINNRIETLYKSITEDPTFLALNDAQMEVNELMNDVNRTITCAITGEDPSTMCTHNCSTCHSNCH
ncbi:MAG: YlbF family regulator [Clostridia bacterium]|nr:YlbF family regulator [Clostridia bacterium]